MSELEWIARFEEAENRGADHEELWAILPLDAQEHAIVVAQIQRLRDRGIPVTTAAFAPEDRWAAFLAEKSKTFAMKPERVREIADAIEAVTEDLDNGGAL